MSMDIKPFVTVILSLYSIWNLQQHQERAQLCQTSRNKEFLHPKINTRYKFVTLRHKNLNTNGHMPSLRRGGESP